jgi:hypothetical protein
VLPLAEKSLVELPPLGLVVLLEALLVATDDVVATGLDVPDGAEVELDDWIGVGVEGTVGDNGEEIGGATVGDATGDEIEEGTVDETIGVEVDCAERRCGAIARRTRQAHNRSSNRDDILPQ